MRGLAAAISFWIIGSLGATAGAANIAFVVIPASDSPCDTHAQGCFGNVNYEYRIARFEVAAGQLGQFLHRPERVELRHQGILKGLLDVKLRRGGRVGARVGEGARELFGKERHAIGSTNDLFDPGFRQRFSERRLYSPDPRP